MTHVPGWIMVGRELLERQQRVRPRNLLPFWESGVPVLSGPSAFFRSVPFADLSIGRNRADPARPAESIDWVDDRPRVRYTTRVP